MKNTQRPTRTPLANRNILKVKGEEAGFKYRIVNDTGDRIQMFKDMGYEIVSDDSVQVGDRRVANPTKEGTPVQVSVGGGTKAYVMRQREDWYAEDQATKEARLKEQEKSMKADASQGMYGSLKITKD